MERSRLGVVAHLGCNLLTYQLLLLAGIYCYLFFLLVLDPLKWQHNHNHNSSTNTHTLANYFLFLFFFLRNKHVHTHIRKRERDFDTKVHHKLHLQISRLISLSRVYYLLFFVWKKLYCVVCQLYIIVIHPFCIVLLKYFLTIVSCYTTSPYWRATVIL